MPNGYGVGRVAARNVPWPRHLIACRTIPVTQRKQETIMQADPGNSWPNFLSTMNSAGIRPPRGPPVHFELTQGAVTQVYADVVGFVRAAR